MTHNMYDLLRTFLVLTANYFHETCFRPGFALKPHWANCHIKILVTTLFNLTTLMQASVNDILTTDADFTGLSSVFKSDYSNRGFCCLLRVV